MILGINIKALDNKKNIFNSNNLANFLSNLIMNNSIEEKKQIEIMDFLKNFNPDKNFVNSISKPEIRNYNLRYTNEEFLKIILKLLDFNPTTKSIISYDEILKMANEPEVIQEFKKGKKIKLEEIKQKDNANIENNVLNSANYFNLFNYDYFSKENNNERELRNWSNSRTEEGKDENSGSKNNSSNKDLKSTSNNSTFSRNNNNMTNKNNANYNSNITQNFKKLFDNLTALSNKINSEIENEKMKMNNSQTKINYFENQKNFSGCASQLKDSKSKDSFSSSKNNSNSNSKDLGNPMLNITNKSFHSYNFESGIKNNINFALNDKFTTRNSNCKIKKIKLNKLKKFDEAELIGYKKKLHENVCHIDHLNKNLMKDYRNNYNFLLNNSKTNFLKPTEDKKSIKHLEFISLIKTYDILKKNNDIPLSSDTQILNNVFNKISIFSQNLNTDEFQKTKLNLIQQPKINLEYNQEYNGNSDFNNGNRLTSENLNNNQGKNLYNHHTLNDNLYNKFKNQVKGFNASDASLKNPNLNNNITNSNDKDAINFDNLMNRKNYITFRKSKMQIIQTVNQSNSKSNIEKFSNLNIEQDKNSVKNFNNNNIQKDGENKSKLLEIDKNNGNNKLQNNLILIEQSPINESIFGNKIKNNNLLFSSNRNENEKTDKNNQFEINNCNFSLNTYSKRNNNIQEKKNTLSDQPIGKNQENNYKEINTIKSLLNKPSKDFSFKNPNSKFSVQEQIENSLLSNEDEEKMSKFHQNLIKNNTKLQIDLRNQNDNLEISGKTEELNYNLLTNKKQNNIFESKNNNHLELKEKKNIFDKNDFPKNLGINDNKSIFKNSILHEIESPKNNFDRSKNSTNLIIDSKNNNIKINSEKISFKYLKPNNTLLKENSNSKIYDVKSPIESNENQKINFSRKNSDQYDKSMIENKNSFNDKNDINKLNLNNINQESLNCNLSNNINKPNYNSNNLNSNNINFNKNKNDDLTNIINNENSNPQFIKQDKNLTNNTSLNDHSEKAVDLLQIYSIDETEKKNELLDNHIIKIENKSIYKETNKNLEISNKQSTCNIAISTSVLNKDKSLVVKSNPFLQNNVNALKIGNIINDHQTTIPENNTNNNQILVQSKNLNSELININDNFNSYNINKNTNLIPLNNIHSNITAENSKNISHENNGERMDITTVNINNITNQNNNLINPNNFTKFNNSNNNYNLNQNPNNPINKNNVDNNIQNSIVNPNNNSNLNLNTNFNLSNNSNFVNSNLLNIKNNPVQNIIGNNILSQINLDNTKSLANLNNPFVIAKPGNNTALLNNPYSTTSNNFINSSLVNNGNSTINNLSSNTNLNNIHNNSNLLNIIDSKKDFNTINSNNFANNNNNLNNFNLNQQIGNLQKTNNNETNNYSNNRNILNCAPSNFKNPFLSISSGNQTNSNNSNLNNNVNSFIPKGSTNAFIVDSSKNNYQQTSLFSNNPPNRNRSYYTKNN